MKKIVFLSFLIISIGFYINLKIKKNSDEIIPKESLKDNSSTMNDSSLKDNLTQILHKKNLSQNSNDSKRTRPSKIIYEIPKNVNWDKVDILETDNEGNVYLKKDSLEEHKDFFTFHDTLILKGSLKGKPNNQKIKIEKPSLWPDGIVPYVIDSRLEIEGQVLTAIDFMNQQTNLQFIPRQGQKDYIYFTSGKEHCYSFVGKVGGKQEIKLSNGCRVGEILHEMNHAVGRFHEQSREDRDNYIEIFWGNIEEKFHDQFRRVPKSVFNLYNDELDLQSIMMYDPYSFALDKSHPTIISKDGSVYTKNESELSYWDIEVLNMMYKK
ncbi:MAG: M12 family metallopeptidase [Halobacteriovoraceae bacterium]|nr:M12 family metallopeptidase [Halobacteriovoraceae bacterium]